MQSLFIGLLLLISVFCQAQTFSSEQAIADLTFLQEKILENNPGIPVYTPDFQQTSDAVIQSVSGELTAFELFQKICQMAALSNEGHYELGTRDDIVHDAIFNQAAPFLPIAIKVVDNKLYVWGDFTEKGYFERGDQILSINGRTDRELIDRMKKHVPTDGQIETYPLLKISSNFPSYYYYYIERPKAFVVEYISAQEKVTKKDTLQALSTAERVVNYKSRYQPEKKEASIDDFYTLEWGSNYGILTLKSFDYRLIEKYDLKAKTFYKEVFSEIKAKQIEHLIIDLRNNTGGRKMFGDQIVPFTRKKELSVPFLIQSVSWKGKKRTRKIPKRDRLAFEGKIYVLTNGLTYSVAAIIARHLKEFADATIIGEEGGSRYEGFVAGSSRYAHLPNSQIRVGIPCYQQHFPPSQYQKVKNRGLLPDIVISPSLEDWLGKKDPVLDAALKLINP